MSYKIFEWDKFLHFLVGVAITILVLSMRPIDSWFAFWVVFDLACFWEVLFPNPDLRSRVMDIIATLFGWIIIVLSLAGVYYYTLIGEVMRLLGFSFFWI